MIRIPSRSNLRFSNWTLMGWSSTTRIEGAAMSVEQNGLACAAQARHSSGLELVEDGCLARRLQPIRLHRILHQHGHGHRTDAAGYRRDFGAQRRNRVELNVARKAITGFLRRVRYAVDPHVDDYDPGFHHVSRDELCPSNGCDQDVGLSRDG